MNDDNIAYNLPNRTVLIICIVLAALFWFVIRMSEDYKMEIRVPIKYELQDSMTFAAAPIESVIYVIKATGWNFLGSRKKRMERDSILISLDKAQQQTISQSQLFRYVSSTPLRKFEIISTRPELLKITQEKAQYKKVPVIIPISLEFREHYNMVGRIKLEPDSILIKGPRSEVSHISFWNADSLTLKDIHDTIRREITLNQPMSKVLTLLTEKVELTAPVEQYTENTIFVPIEIINPINPEMEIFPTRVRLKFKVPLSRYDAIKKEDFKVVVDGSSSVISDNKLLINISLKSPWVKDFDYEPKLVEFFIQSD